MAAYDVGCGLEGYLFICVCICSFIISLIIFNCISITFYLFLFIEVVQKVLFPERGGILFCMYLYMRRRFINFSVSFLIVIH